jgi:ribonucleotide reductase beta subunit family protein with ferritin-like domain
VSVRRLTEPRTNLRPAEYPEFLAYRDAIRHSYWLHTEYNLTDDVHDFRTRATPVERSAIRNTLLAIAQVEVAVKTFWGDLMHRYPKPEVGAVGFTFAESEVRHQDAYAHLLEVLGLNTEFERLEEFPALRARVRVLDEHLKRPRSYDPEADGREHALGVLLFAAFVEHASLFAQFLIMKSFDRERNRFKGIANIVEATSKEEQIHAMFGYKVVEVLRRENPHWFDADLEARVLAACRDARAAEAAILDWIFALRRRPAACRLRAHLPPGPGGAGGDALVRGGGAGRQAHRLLPQAPHHLHQEGEGDHGRRPVRLGACCGGEACCSGAAQDEREVAEDEVGEDVEGGVVPGALLPQRVALEREGAEGRERPQEAGAEREVPGGRQEAAVAQTGQ